MKPSGKNNNYLISIILPVVLYSPLFAFATDSDDSLIPLITIIKIKQTEKPLSLPDIKLYTDQSPLNQKLPADVELEPESSRYVTALTQGTEAMLVQYRQYSAPVYFSDSTTSRTDVLLHCGQTWERGVNVLKNVPIPSFAEPSNDIDGADNPIIAGQCGENSSQDNNMVIIDLQNRCEYDLWQARKETGRWAASWGNAISIDSMGVFDTGLSARGSGFAFLAGVIWPHELASGVINHALLFALPVGLVKGGGPVAPATETDGESTNPDAIPEGARLRLDPTLDLNTLNLTPAALTIARAMQDYGMFLTDRGGSPYLVLYAVDPRSVQGNPYAGYLPDQDFPPIDGIPLDRLQLVKLPPQDPDFASKLTLPNNGCATFGLEN